MRRWRDRTFRPWFLLRWCRVYARWETEQPQTKHPILVVRSLHRQIGVNTRVILGLVAASVALIALVALFFLFLHLPNASSSPDNPPESNIASSPQSRVTALNRHRSPPDPLGQPGTGCTAPLTADRIGPYELEKEIQPIIDGWTSLTYLAAPQSGGPQVVLKLANRLEPVAKRLEVEREIYSLGLAGVPRLLDAGSDAGFDYIITERVHAADLRTHVDRNGVFNETEAGAIGLQVCESMEALHYHQWLHCDLTPANLLIDKQARAYLIDFGLAVKFGADGPAGISGTPSFLSPEIINQAPLVPSSDIYSFGCVLYFMLTGQKPYSGNTSIETLWKQSKGRLPQFPSDLPISQPMQELVHRCLLKDPADRPKSFGELKQLLKGFS